MKSFTDYQDQKRNYEIEINEFCYLTQKTHNIVEIGIYEDLPVFLFESKNSNETLVTSGWQGDEPAGWCAAKVLCTRFPQTSFIPFVSPACFLTRQHRNYEGKNVDRGWPEIKTQEGMILQSNLYRLITLGRECFLSLQEDPKRFTSYFYAWNESNEIADIVQRKLTEHFSLSENSKTSPPKGLFCEHMVKHGCKMAIQTETPADGSFTLSKRIDCQVAVVEAVIKRVISLS